jgi:D-Tyr-tRNAtyr deacylase
MNNHVKKIALGLLVIMAASGSVSAGSAEADVLKLNKVAMSSRLMIQTVAKDYLYIGNDIAVTKARKEMAAALKSFEEKQKKLAQSLNDPKIKNLMMFIEMNVEEIRETLKQPYSLDNAAVIIDLAEAVSEGEQKIADEITKKAKIKVPEFMGQRYNITQVAKYYMAYQAGLKDDVTVRQMKMTVEKMKKALADMKTNKDNNAKMNQILARTDKQWKIVHQFYLDIEEGGLPLIVYQTSGQLAKGFLKYFTEFVHVKEGAKAQ